MACCQIGAKVPTGCASHAGSHNKNKKLEICKVMQRWVCGSHKSMLTTVAQHDAPSTTTAVVALNHK